MLGFVFDPFRNPAMTNSAKKSGRREAPAIQPEPARRVAPQRATADPRFRTSERMTTGLTVVLSREERLSVHRIRRILARMLESREADPPVRQRRELPAPNSAPSEAGTKIFLATKH
jgi:hypothetical protein